MESHNMPFPKVNLERTSALCFFVDFMLRNEPCIICASATAKWKSRKLWVKRIGDKNVINYEYLIKQYGHLEVPVTKKTALDGMAGDSGECTKFDGKKLCCSQKYDEYQKIRLKDYIERMIQKDDGLEDIGYAKDWHFQRDSGTSYEMYGLPSGLRFDWINNEMWSNDDQNQLGDYRFVYFGAKDTWTPFHTDVMSSHSWSANICGRKLWYFVPPGNEECFRIGRDTFSDDIRTMQHIWPKANVRSFVQEEGEIVFVPSNWYHQVHNLESAISINHNFFNASNVDFVVELIAKRLMDVDKELADCRSCFSAAEYGMYCEQILAADIRVNFAQLTSLLELIVNDRANDVDECWICWKHRSFVECKRNNSCLESIRTVIQRSCNCQLNNSDEICSSCLNFMKKFDIFVAAECLMRLRYIREKRTGS